jgi:hypothetical protein
MAGAGALDAMTRRFDALDPTREEMAVAGRRPIPENPLAIRDGDLEVVFDSRDGLPVYYSYKGQRLWGETTNQQIRAILCHVVPREYQSVSVLPASSRQSRREVIFTFKPRVAGAVAAIFDLRYVLSGASMLLTMEHVNEAAGYELIELALPQLVTVFEQDGPAWMAEGREGGSFVRLEEARAFEFPDDDFFGRISTELPIGMVGQNGIGCVMEVAAYMDGTETRISGTSGNRRATIGTIQTHRVDGQRCYGMNNGGPPVCGNVHTRNLLVGQQPRCRFDFFTCDDEAHPWLAGARIVRERVPQSPTEFFSNRFLYIVAGKKKTEVEPRTTFAQSAQLVRDVAMLTDNAPQTVFISGWAYDGQDTGFPSEDKINSSLGTYDDLCALLKDGKQWNANITLNVNYDDAYRSSPLFDEDFIARRPDGRLWESLAWDGETSYIVGMAKYMEGGWGNRRIDYAMERYPIANAILIDAMSWFAIRNDWDPQHPASGYRNLIAGKYKILERFSKYGVAVTSEKLRYPFIGKLAVTMNGPGISSCPFGGEAVPLVATVYRRAAIWGSSGDGTVHPQQEIFWNTRSALWFQADSDRAAIADFYYLVVLPFTQLHRLQVEGFESAGSFRRLLLGQRSHVTIDTASRSYAAAVNGVEIARDESTCCPIDANRIAFYSRTACELRYPLPPGWDPLALTARSLTLEGRVNHEVRCVDGTIAVSAAERQPIIVYYDRR